MGVYKIKNLKVSEYTDKLFVTEYDKEGYILRRYWIKREDLIECEGEEERKAGEWIRTGRTNVYGGEELMCPFCGDRVMVQNIEYELYCRQCGALLGDRIEGE